MIFHDRGRLGIVLAALLLTYGAATRLIALAERPFTVDESSFAAIAYRIATTDQYRYDARFHGPLLHYLNAGFFSLFGDSDTTARLPSALIGIVFLGLALPLARERGSRIGLAFLALTTLSPTYTFLSREVRGDVLVLLLSSGCFFLALRSSPRAIPIMIVLAAAAAATKLTAVVTLGIAGVATIMAAPTAVIERLRTLNWRMLGMAGGAIAVSVLLLILFHTGFGARPSDWNVPVRAAFFWLGLQLSPIHPGGFLYFPGLLAVYEPLICILALAGFRFVRRDPWCRFLALFFIGSLAFYGWAQEKVPHLVLYPLLPATLLAAEALGSFRRRFLLGLAAIALVGTALVQTRVISRCGVLDPQQPSRIEALAYRTMSSHFPDFVERVRTQSKGRVVAADPLFWMLLVWPLRDQTLRTVAHAPWDALRVTQSLRGELVSCVWVPAWEEASMQQILRYALTQQIFGAFSCQVGAIYQARGSASKGELR